MKSVESRDRPGRREAGGRGGPWPRRGTGPSVSDTQALKASAGTVAGTRGRDCGGKGSVCKAGRGPQSTLDSASLADYLHLHPISRTNLPRRPISGRASSAFYVHREADPAVPCDSGKSCQVGIAAESVYGPRAPCPRLDASEVTADDRALPSPFASALLRPILPAPVRIADPPEGLHCGLHFERLRNPNHHPRRSRGDHRRWRPSPVFDSAPSIRGNLLDRRHRLVVAGPRTGTEPA